MNLISEPCVLDIPMDKYHSKCGVGDDGELSSGDLVAISKNPAKWFAHHWSNPKRREKADKSVFAFGRAAHAVVVGGEVFDENYEIRPDEFDSYRTKASKEWRDMVIEAGRTPLTPADMETVKDMAEAIKASPEALAAFESGKPEQSLFWKRDGIWLKARPDQIPAQDSRVILDYKTVASVEPRKLKIALGVDFGWIQKLANVTDGMIATGMVKFEPLSDSETAKMSEEDIQVATLGQLDFLLICQEKTYPHEVVVVTIEACDIADMMRLNARVRQEYKQSLSDMAAKKLYSWRGMNDGFFEYKMEEWELARMATRYGGINGLPPVDINFEPQRIAA